MQPSGNIANSPTVSLAASGAGANGAVLPGQNLSKPVVASTNPVANIAPVVSTAPTTSSTTTTTTPTTISGDMSSTISNNTNSINNTNASIQQNKVAQFSGGLEQYSNGSPMNAPVGAVQQSDENGNTWYTFGGKNYALGPDTGLSPEDQQSQDLLTQMKTQSDSAFAGQISAIQAQFASLVATQKQVNAGAEGSVNQSMLMGGAQYTTAGAGEAQAQVSYGIQQLSDLASQEQTAIAAVNAAQANADYQIADKQLALLDKIQTDKQNVLSKLNDSLIQANKDAKAALIAQNKVTYDEVTQPIQNIATDAAKNGADPQTIAAINAATTVQDAIKAAGGSLQTATGQLGDYLQYKKDAEGQGLVPQDYTTWKAADDAKTAKEKASEAYSTAYASAKGSADANNSSGGYDGTTQKEQEALEQQLRTYMKTTQSSRGGTYQTNNAKVSQANKVAALLNQAYDPKTGNYNLSAQNYGEALIGAAAILSGSTNPTNTQLQDLATKTGIADFNKIQTYLSGNVANGASQSVIKNLVATVDREAQAAVSDRDELYNEITTVGTPTDLDPQRSQAILSAGTLPYNGITGVERESVDNYLKANGSQTVQLPDGPHSMYYVVSQLYAQPGATDKDVSDYLKAKGYIQ